MTLAAEVLMDATPLGGGHAQRGIGAATRGMLAGLREILPEGGRPRLLVRHDQEAPAGFAVERVRWPEWSVHRLPDLWPRLTVERDVRRLRPRLFFATQHELVPDGRRVPLVATCYDLTPLFGALRTDRRTLLVRANLARLRRARLVVCPSAATARDAAAMLAVSEHRLRVVPLAASPPSPPMGPTHDRPYILYANSLEPHKNPGLAVEALAACASDLDLVVVGVGSPALQNDLLAHARQMGVSDRLIFHGYVSESRLSALRRDAVAVLVPSLREGFGLPVLEAMIAGCPTLVADTPALAEVCGDAAPLLPPNRPEEWARVIDDLVRDPGQRTLLAERGRARAAEFSWTKVAADLVAVWEDALDAGASAGGGRRTPTEEI